MSWSVLKTGTPKEVVEYLKEHGTYLQDQSKEEYDAALPHLIALVEQNIEGAITISAYEHGVKDADGKFSIEIARFTLQGKFPKIKL